MLKKIISVFLFVLIFVNNTFAYDTNSTINSSGSNDTSNSKIINYIDSKIKNLSDNVFCIGSDKIYYYESFLDEERDYYNLPFSKHTLSNTDLTEQQKQVNPINLKMKYEHNPNYYDNPVSPSLIAGEWYDVQVSWDTDKEKWQLTESTKDILFESPTDDKRGEWTIYLKGTDATGKTIFDKEAIGFAKFRVHKAPVPSFKISENSTTFTLTDNGSYDIDYKISKNSKKNIKDDRAYNGIKEFYWSVKIDNIWVDAGNGPSITLSKSGRTITDYMLTVEDYDGAKTSISKSSLLFEKPAVDFNFLANSTYTTYFYKGNAGKETVSVNPLISWNDEAYNSTLYSSSGTQIQTWTSINNTKYSNDSTKFKNEVLMPFYDSAVKDNKLPVELEAKNKYDLFNTKLRTATIIPITTSNKTGTVGTVNCSDCENSLSLKPFLVGTTAPLLLDITNKNVVSEDIKMVLNAPNAGINDLEIPISENKLRYDITLEDPDSYTEAWWDKFSYNLKIYSKRTKELLNTDSGNIYIHTPVPVTGFINGSNDNIEVNYDDNIEFSATTPKYAKTVTVKLPFATIVEGTTIPANTAIQLVPNSSHTAWNKTIKIATEISSDMEFTALFEAVAYNGRDKSSDTLTGIIIAYKLENLRVTMIRDLRLEAFYKSERSYEDKEMDVNSMGIDPLSFYPFPIDYLTKGYVFEFKIDSTNFNDDVDKIIITPSFYAATGNYRDSNTKNAYWIDSNKKVTPIGEGGHSNYRSVVLTKSDRKIINANDAEWSGKYMIPGTTFLTDTGVDVTNALSNRINADIIVNFNIVGYKGNSPKFNYNTQQWAKELTTSKIPYKIGDIIRYSDKSNLDDLNVIRVRP